MLITWHNHNLSTKMNGYSKISTAHEPRSMDFSDLTSFPQPPKDKANAEEAGKKEDEGERFGVILGRSGSVSSASGFQATMMKRAFSMRRSSSVSERYCRIHDQYMAIGDDEVDANNEIMGTRRSMKKKQRGGKILKACKRLLGL